MSVDLAVLTADDFAPHAGTPWRVVGAGPNNAQGPVADLTEPVALELIEVSAGREPAAGRPRRSFSLLFRGPRAPHLPQRIYFLEHAAMGTVHLFLVPITLDAQGSLYQAVFN
jgi:hypothetical protein